MSWNGLWLALTAIACTGLIVSFLIAMRRMRRPRERSCPKCHYLLPDSQVMRCSECGHEATSEHQLHRPDLRGPLRACLAFTVAGVLCFSCAITAAGAWASFTPNTIGISLLQFDTTEAWAVDLLTSRRQNRPLWGWQERWLANVRMDGACNCTQEEIDSWQGSPLQRLGATDYNPEKLLARVLDEHRDTRECLRLARTAVSDAEKPAERAVIIAMLIEASERRGLRDQTSAWEADVEAVTLMGQPWPEAAAAVPTLISMLNEQWVRSGGRDWKMDNIAIDTLAQIGPPARDAIEPLFAYHENRRGSALRTIACIAGDDPRVRKRFIAALSDLNNHARYRAVLALERHPDAHADMIAQLRAMPWAMRGRGLRGLMTDLRARNHRSDVLVDFIAELLGRPMDAHAAISVMSAMRNRLPLTPDARAILRSAAQARNQSISTYAQQVLDGDATMRGPAEQPD